jgi:hypothetical protein
MLGFFPVAAGTLAESGGEPAPPPAFTNKLFVGAQEPDAIYLGTSLVSAIYLGSIKVYEDV